MPNNRLCLKDFLLIAEATLGVSCDELERTICIFRTQSSLAAPFVRVWGVYLFSDPVEQAAICALRIIRTRPLPTGNKKVAYECMREMLLRSGLHWSRPEEDAEEIAETLIALQARELPDAEFIRWVQSRVTA